MSGTPRDRVAAALVGHFLDRWENDEALQLLLRSGVTNKAAAERLRDIFAGQLLPVVSALTGDPSQAPVRAALVASQMLGIALTRYILQLPPLVAMSREELIQHLRPTLEGYLTR